MVRRILLLVCGLALFAADIQADSHEEGEGPGRRGRPHHPHLMIPLPPDIELPPREDGPEAFVEAAIAALDRNGNGALDAEEILGAMKKMRDRMKKHHKGGPDGKAGPGGCGCGGDEDHDHEHDDHEHDDDDDDADDE